LLSEQRVRDALHAGIKTYEAYLDKAERVNPGSKEHFIGAAKPVFTKIIDEGTWPPNCSFFGFYRLTSTVGNESVNYDGFWLRLKVDTPTEKFGGFALPIIDLAYGKIELCSKLDVSWLLGRRANMVGVSPSQDHECGRRSASRRNTGSRSAPLPPSFRITGFNT
jgi:hypothetical protein